MREEERLKAEQARIQTQQELDIRAENHQREVEVAQQNRERAVVIEKEKVFRARDLEIVSREREVELQRIEKEKALEEERKNIASVIRERVAVEKTVAQEEERIKEVREVSEAERMKQVIVLNAQAEAEQELVAGMILSNEPGYYKAGEYGIRIENLVLVEPRRIEGGEGEWLGFETLTLAPIDAALVEPSLLTAAEIAWWNAYHARVREVLAPRLEGEALAWLETACAPL